MLYQNTKPPKISQTNFNKSVTVVVETHTIKKYAYYDFKKEQWIENVTGAVVDVLCWYYEE